MPRFEGELREDEEATQRHGGTRDGRTPPRPTGTWVQAEGGKGGERTGTGTAEDAGTRRGAQGRAAEAGGWQVRETPRWAALCTGRGGGERVKRDDFDEERLRMRRRWESGGGGENDNETAEGKSGAEGIV